MKSFLLSLLLVPGAAWAAEPAPPASMPGHVIAKASAIAWGDAPPMLERGAQAAVLSGDPGQAGQPFVMRLKAPAGYRIARHWHPTDEHATVLEGSVVLEMGDGAQAHTETFNAGDYVLLPARMRHAASMPNGAVVQLHGVGPFEINYVDPKDDPRKRMPEKAPAP